MIRKAGRVVVGDFDYDTSTAKLGLGLGLSLTTWGLVFGI